MARRNTPIAEFPQLWQRHEKIYHGIFVEALNQLELTEEQRNDENQISDALNPILRQVCCKHRDKPALPQWERPIVSYGALNGGKSSKRPDFTCSLVNTFHTSPEDYELSLHIECKCLGTKRGTWDLNKNYVEKGVKRFHTISHEYGKRSPSGMMVGYIINSDKREILRQVNGYLSGALLQIAFVFKEKVESCDMTISRDNVEPKEFKLIHIWADLRPTTHQAS
jgi:hypothetical protein